MSRPSRLPLAAEILGALLAAGTVGFMITQELDFVDALFYTVITISTVGYNEPPGGFTGPGQVVAIVLVVSGVGALFYTAAIAFEAGIERILSRSPGKRQQKEITALEDHVILCGFGNVGRNAYTLLRQHSDDIVVIEADPEAAEEARDAGALVVDGDATHDETLLKAGLDRCGALVASVRNDPDNLVIVLSARARRPDLLIVARATEAESESKLRLAGANRVVSPQVVAAHRLATLAVQPEVADFIDLVVQGELFELRVERCEVLAGSSVDGRSIQEAAIRQHSGALVLAVIDADGGTVVNPSPDRVIRHGEALIGIGTIDQVSALRALTHEPAEAGT